MEEARDVLEEFAERGLNAAPTAWEVVDDACGTVQMVPVSTRHTLTIEPVRVHESASEVKPLE